MKCCVRYHAFSSAVCGGCHFLFDELSSYSKITSDIKYLADKAGYASLSTSCNDNVKIQSELDEILF